jgi:hypothetical protein
MPPSFERVKSVRSRSENFVRWESFRRFSRLGQVFVALSDGLGKKRTSERAAGVRGL